MKNYIFKVLFLASFSLAAMDSNKKKYYFDQSAVNCDKHLDAHILREHITVEGHKNPIQSLCAIENKLASGSAREIKIWDLDKEITTLKADGFIHSLCEINDKLISGSSHNEIKLWNLNFCREIATFKGHTGSVYSVCPIDNTRFASGSGDGTIKIWSVDDGKEICTLRGHVGPVYSLCLADDKLVSGSGDGTIKTWDLNNYKNLETVQKYQGPVYNLCHLAQNRLAATVCELVKICNLDTKKEIAEFSGYYNNLCKVQENLLALGANSNDISVLDVNSCKEMIKIKGQEGAARILCKTQNEKIAAVSGGKKIKIWNLKNHLKSIQKSKKAKCELSNEM